MWGCSLSLCRGALRPSVLRGIRLLAPRELKVRLGLPPAFCSDLRAGSALQPGVDWAPPAGLGTPWGGLNHWEEEEASASEDESEPAARAGGNTFAKFGIEVLVALLRQENGKDICVISLPPEMKYTDYFVIVSASSTRHLHAIAQYALKVYKRLNDQKNTGVRIEGKETEDWMCIDFGNIIVHFMLPETRETYELEKLWTLRCYDDQLSLIKPETLPEDFIYGLHKEKSASEDGLNIEQSTLEDGADDIGGRKV